MRALVTGGGGFLGGAIVRLLRARGDQVRSFSRSSHPELAALGVEHIMGDLGDRQSVLRAAEGCAVIFHVAAKAGIWGSYEEFYTTNVAGTENVLTACQAQGAAKLVYTSSPSVVFDGRDVEGGDESLPYPGRYGAYYPQTKAMAEQRVCAANGPHLATVSLRPHLIWGPGDTHLVPGIIDRGMCGRLRRIGTRSCLVDAVYVDDAAAAHLQAADRLEPGGAASGKAYFITGGESVRLWDMVDRILASAGIPPVSATVTPRVAYAAGAICEGIWSLFGLSGEPPMTRFLARELSTAHWFTIDAARKDLGYEPRVSVEEGLRRLSEWERRTVQAQS